MSYYGFNDYRNYLAHYGVKGMRWRHRKGATNSINSGLNQSLIQTPYGAYIVGKDKNGNRMIIQASKRGSIGQRFFKSTAHDSRSLYTAIKNTKATNNYKNGFGYVWGALNLKKRRGY